MTQMTPSKNLPKTRRQPKLAPGLRLTDRDREVLYDVWTFRYLPTSLIIERRFGSATRGRARLKLLYHHGFVDRHFLPTAGPGVGEAIYSLGPAAVPELASFYGLEPAELKRRRRPVEPFFIAHHLAVARFRSRVGSVATADGVGLYDWREERAARLNLPGGETLVPDGIAWLATPRARFAFCLEVDRGTMTVGRVRTKFERYREVERTGLLTRLMGAERFRVLVVASSTRRLRSLHEAAEGANARGVWLTTEEAVASDPVREPVWLRPGVPGHFPLFRPEQVSGKSPDPQKGSRTPRLTPPTRGTE